MAGLLVDLVELTLTGFQTLAEQEPDSALRLPAEANDHLEPITERNESSQTSTAGAAQAQGFDKVE